MRDRPGAGIRTKNRVPRRLPRNAKQVPPCPPIRASVSPGGFAPLCYGDAEQVLLQSSAVRIENPVGSTTVAAAFPVLRLPPVRAVPDSSGRTPARGRCIVKNRRKRLAIALRQLPPQLVHSDISICYSREKPKMFNSGANEIAGPWPDCHKSAYRTSGASGSCCDRETASGRSPRCIPERTAGPARPVNRPHPEELGAAEKAATVRVAASAIQSGLVPTPVFAERGLRPGTD